MASRISSAVIGCGRMGAFTSESVQKYAPQCWFPLSHAEAIQRHPALELSALCDTNLESLEKASTAYGISRTYSDHRTLLDEVKPKLIGIATRTVGRTEIITSAADSGVQALHIEKPLCNSMRELEALAGTLAKVDLYCTYGTIRRFFRVYQAARQLVTSGVYGALREIRVNMGHGMLFWSHPHSVDLILYIAGDRQVEAVQARLSNVLPGKSEVEITSDPFIDSASIYFSDGVSAHITAASGFSLVISCGDAEIAVKNDGEGIVISAPRAGNPYYSDHPYEGTYSAPDAEGTFGPVAHLVKCLSDDEGERFENLKLKCQTLQGHKILFAMVQSNIEQSRLVRVQDTDPGIIVHAKSGDRYA